MQNTQHLLIVDDDREIRDLLSRFLTKHGFRVTAAADGREMQRQLDAGRFDLVVLDLMMPGDDGLTLCRQLRTRSQIPVIMLTAMGEDTDRIVGLEVGADDYVAKPFNPRELLARIKAVLRRSEPSSAANSDPVTEDDEHILIFESWQVDLVRRELRTEAGTPCELTSGEYDLLLAFLERPNRVLTRDQLLDLTKGRAGGPFDRAIDVQLSRLRRKIENDPKAPQLIKTIRGGGYMFTARVTRK